MLLGPSLLEYAVVVYPASSKVVSTSRDAARGFRHGSNRFNDAAFHFSRLTSSLHLPIHTMTSVNPSHNVFRHSEGRHAQAVHQSTQFPDDLPAKDDDSIDGDLPRVKKEARKRVRQQMPPMPDLRFEQVGQALPYRRN